MLHAAAVSSLYRVLMMAGNNGKVSAYAHLSRQIRQIKQAQTGEL